MATRIFSHQTRHWRNGKTWIGRTIVAGIGEDRYDGYRVQKRTMKAEVYYLKQHWLHQLYINKPDWANFFALIPKPDSSHGFPWKDTPSRYAQFAEDNFNSDGYFNWYTYTGCTAATIWAIYVYFWPRRWYSSYDFLNEENLERLKYCDAMTSATYDQSFSYNWTFWQQQWTPHKFAWWRKRANTHFAPDAKLRPCTITLNQMNTVYDHTWRGYGNQDTML